MSSRGEGCGQIWTPSAAEFLGIRIGQLKQMGSLSTKVYLKNLR
ncbi:hypothetical protein [Paenibacillus foliorum]|nr:hypothetical protein [Paenibacillus foliorum]